MDEWWKQLRWNATAHGMNETPTFHPRANHLKYLTTLGLTP